MNDLIEKFQQTQLKGLLPPSVAQTFFQFCCSYTEAIQKRALEIAPFHDLLDRYFDLVVKEVQNPFPFEIFHRRIRYPVDYYQLGLEIWRPMIYFDSSTLQGKSYLDEIVAAIAQGENVILLANHQTEPDPQAITLLLESDYPQLVEEMIFVAGHRVITDPLAVPMSLGRNLLCIYSKKYIENPPEEKLEKVHHNQRTMKKMKQLLEEGGKCIYIAPSGGRDRPNERGEVEIPPFYPESIDMCELLASQSGVTTHFYPLALWTYPLLPPPAQIREEIGEQRVTYATPIHLSFGEKIKMEGSQSVTLLSRRELRQARAQEIWSRVEQLYRKLPSKGCWLAQGS